MTLETQQQDILRPMVFVDIETTGGSYKSSRILEVAAIKVDGGKVVDTFHSLINPDEPIPTFITDLTGIAEADIQHAPEFHQIAWQLYDFLDGSTFVAHNVDFDLGFIREAYRILGADFEPPKLCTVRLSRYFYPHFQTHKLGAIIDRHELVVADRHRAMADAQAIVDFYFMITRDFGYEAMDTARAELDA